MYSGNHYIYLAAAQTSNQLTIFFNDAALEQAIRCANVKIKST